MLREEKIMPAELIFRLATLADLAEIVRMLADDELGSQLARAGLDFARERALKVVPLCWFVAGYMDRHSEYRDLLKS